MIEYIKICIPISILSALLMLIASKEKELACVVASFIFAVIVIYTLLKAENIISSLKAFFGQGVYVLYYESLLSLIGISVLGAITSSLCENFGQRILSRAIEAMTVIEVMYLAIPWVTDLFSDIIGMLGD